MSSYHQLLAKQAIEHRTRSTAPTVASGAHREVEPASLSRTASEQAASARAERQEQLRDRVVRVWVVVTDWFRSNDKVYGQPS